MLTAFQDSFRWTNDVVSEVVSGATRHQAPAQRRAYFWRPAVDMRDGRTLCELIPFSYN